MIKLKLDLTKLTGAKRMTSQSGRDVLVIDIAKSRLFVAKSGAIYADLDCVEKKEAGDYGDTHFVAESVTKEGRLGGVKGSIIGNGKELQPFKRPENTERQRPPQPRRNEAPNDDGDDIPF